MFAPSTAGIRYYFHRTSLHTITLFISKESKLSLMANSVFSVLDFELYEKRNNKITLMQIKRPPSHLQPQLIQWKIKDPMHRSKECLIYPLPSKFPDHSISITTIVLYPLPPRLNAINLAYSRGTFP